MLPDGKWSFEHCLEGDWDPQNNKSWGIVPEDGSVLPDGKWSFEHCLDGNGDHRITNHENRVREESVLPDGKWPHQTC
jgi:hypothetical protein